MRHVRLASFALASTVLGAAPAAEWHRLDSPNFVVIGDVGAGTLRDVALRFEGFREAFTRLMSERATATAVPTVVVVFPNDRAFTPYKPLYQGKPISVAGLFHGGRDLNYIALTTGGQDDGVRTVFHEYAHLIVNNLLRDVPAWLNEGLAEFYSTFEVHQGGREVIVGKVVDWHLLRLRSERPLPLDVLLAVDHGSPYYNEKNRMSVFYAQSWALVHRLLRGEPSRATELTRLFAGIARGESSAAAWREAFGDIDLAGELAEYVRRDTFQAMKYRFSEKLASLKLSAAPFAKADAEAVLAGLLLQQQRLDEAGVHLAAAEKLQAASPLVQSVAARHDAARSDSDKASARLLAVAPSNDWLASYLTAVAFAELADAQGGSLRQEQLAGARAAFDGVLKGRGEVANALARRALLETPQAGVPSAEIRRDIERARQLAPGREDYAFAHAHILARMGEYLEARQLLGPMMSVRYSAGIRDNARRLMVAVLELEKARELNATVARLQALSAADLAAAATSDLPNTTTPSSEPPRVQPLFRERQPGEERMEGVLERIDCGASGSATFQVRTVDGPATASASRMDAVDFITYRDDLTGRVSCGALRPALPVFLTWRRSAVEGGKAVVAIEFLPK